MIMETQMLAYKYINCGNIITYAENLKINSI